MKRLLGIVGLATLIALTGCGSPPSASTTAGSVAVASGTTTDTLPALIETAKKERRLTLSWGLGGLVDEASVIPLATGFNKAYGLDIKVEYTFGPGAEDMGTRLLQEVQTKQPATTDIFFASSSSLAPMYTAHALQGSNWADWAPNIKNAGQVAPQGLAVEVETAITGITFNSNKIKGNLIPTSMKDLLKPEYRGKVATTPYVAGFDRLATAEAWGKQVTMDYMAKFSDQIAGLIRCSELQRLVSGEFDVLAFNCDQAETLRNAAKGAALDFVVASDAPFVASNYVAIPINAAHPAASKLWINYLLSPDAQKVIYDASFADSAQVSGSRTAPLLKKYTDHGVSFINTDLAFYERNDLVAMKDTSNELRKLLLKK